MKEGNYIKERPEHGYIYCFRENGENQRFKLDKLIGGVDDKLVYQFINLIYGNNTRMTLKRFNYKLRHHSGKKIPENDSQLKINFDTISKLKSTERTIKETKKTPVQNVKKSVPTSTLAPMHASEDETADKFLDEIFKKVYNKLCGLSDIEIKLFNFSSSSPAIYYIERFEQKRINFGTLLYLESIFKKLNWVI